MNKKVRYFHMTFGYIGLLLFGMSMMRYISVSHDSTGQVLSMFGFIAVIDYIKFLEKAAGVSKKEYVIPKVTFSAVFLTAFLYFF
ncbi:hypothetical protein [Thalassobacillus pellis]|uniref:hypothetical protein n=1 Tax=Thalassobacillus pellis TaxID=748008 RepID=UPI00195F2B0C|nr:hypothetical protein [Thalassobacillus pellis]MBM7553519.1 hypothetical protein [Thalassobacillus pellis]